MAGDFQETTHTVDVSLGALRGQCHERPDGAKEAMDEQRFLEILVTGGMAGGTHPIPDLGTISVKRNGRSTWMN
jgi:hypothetical protein